MTFLVLYWLQLQDAQLRIEEQDRQIREQEELINEKQIFGAAMETLMDTAGKFEGVLTPTLVPVDSYEAIAVRAWSHRWNAVSIQRDTERVKTYTTELEATLAAGAAEASTNVSGTNYEAVIDQLGAGYVSSHLGDVDTLCGGDVLACVKWDDPYVVHFNAADMSVPYSSDFIRTGTAYHEYAHVLQMTNPEPTETALLAFSGDSETMADCYALTYLPGWKLDHRIWINRYEWWEVSVGYGHTCDETQRQAIRDWYEQLGFHLTPISQQR